MSDPTGAEQEFDVIRATHAYLGIVGRHHGAGTTPTPTWAALLADLHAALDDIPADRRAAAIAAVEKRIRGT